MMETLKIDITVEDIKNGIRWSWDQCPIALAVKRAVKAEYVHIGDKQVTITKLQSHRPLVYQLSDEGAQFYYNFDHGHSVKPTSIILTLKTKGGVCVDPYCRWPYHMHEFLGRRRGSGD
jgi:hypothetical protein